MRCDYARAGREPALEEVLRDPIVQLVMRRDGLGLADVRCSVDAARRRLSPSTGTADQAAHHSSSTIRRGVC